MQNTEKVKILSRNPQNYKWTHPNDKDSQVNWSEKGSSLFHNGYNTLKCLSIGTPKTINFPFVANGKLMVFRCTNIQVHYNEAVI